MLQHFMNIDFDNPVTSLHKFEVKTNIVFRYMFVEDFIRILNG